ncbi:hypothetical protein [Hymenobacter daeguensis]
MTATPFLRLTALFIGLLLSGCCANNVCNCNDAQEDIIKLVFSSRFTTAELDTLVLVRYPLLYDSLTTKPETVTLIRLGAQPNDTIFLNNSTPFAQIGTARLNQYRYQIRYRRAPRPAKLATALLIDQVTLKGSFEGDGCCTCYTNYDKRIAARQDSSRNVRVDTVYNLRPRPVFTIYKKP